MSAKPWIIFRAGDNDKSKQIMGAITKKAPVMAGAVGADLGSKRQCQISFTFNGGEVL
jgi:hypothetical protein